jgi:apolipoprotein N-acyltransferase
VSGARALLAATLSGVLLALSFPKFGRGWVAWLAVLPLLVCLVNREGRSAARLGYASGVVSSVGLLYWTGFVVAEFGGLSATLAVTAVLLLGLVAGVFLALFGAVLGLWLRAFGHIGVLAAPLAWVAVELLRRHVLFSFPWCLLGYSQHDALAVAQLAAVTGVYGLSFIVVLVASIVAFALAEKSLRRRLLIAGLGLGLLGGVVGWGSARLRAPLASVGSMRVGLIQAAIPQDEKWQAVYAWRNIERHVTLSVAAKREGAELIIWPESAVPFYFDSTPPVADMLRRLVQDEGVYLLFGNDDRSEEGGGRVWVGAKLLTPGGTLALRYHKMRLVPFGEYVPLERLFGALGMKRLVQEAGSFTPGTDAVVGLAGRARVGASICYEDIFPDLTRRFTLNGAELLANVTNDGWYGRTSAPYQHFAMARLRAIENGRSFVRAANTGISALVDPRGRILAQTQLFEQRALVGDVPLTRESTFYARHGDVFAWACLVASVLLSALAWVRGRPSGSSSPAA